MLDYTRLDAIGRERPLLHCIANLVTAHDCAAVALAVGASPIMAYSPQEMEEIAGRASAVVLNTGTPDEERLRACRISAGAASKLEKPLILDPVGVGASTWRLRNVLRIFDLASPAILRLNPGEARALLGDTGGQSGVDDLAEETSDERLRLASKLSQKYTVTVLLSGPTDVVTDGRRSFLIPGGSSRMTRITGAGCMLSVLCGAFAAVTADPVEAAVLASLFWKLCAQCADREAGGRGTGSFHTALFDAASTMTSKVMSDASVRMLKEPDLKQDQT